MHTYLKKIHSAISLEQEHFTRSRKKTQTSRILFNREKFYGGKKIRRIFLFLVFAIQFPLKYFRELNVKYT